MAEYLPSWAVPSTSTFPYYLNIQKSNKIIDQISLISPQNSSSTTPSSSSILFGRHKECNIILDHSSISRKHALIFFDNQNNSYLIDLNSSHGTKINQQNLTPFQYYQLHENDIIEFGQSSRQYIYCKHDITSNTISTPTTSSSSRPVVPLFHEDVKDDNTQSQQSIEIISGDEYEKREKILSKEEERKLRQQEIAAYALEMSSTVPIFNSTRSTLTKEDLAQVAQNNLDLDGATIEYEDLNLGDDGEDLEEEEDSDDNEIEAQPIELDHVTTSKNKDLTKTSKEQPMNDLETLALSRKIPLSHEVDLSPHGKACTCISFEPSGNRVVTGSLDYNIKLYDFGGMDKRHLSFKSLEVDEGHSVTAISHSPSGDRFIVCTASCQPKIFDRNGEKIIAFCRGDMYLRDMTNTKGHTMETTDCHWHPTDKNLLMTSGLDGTLRLWDLRGEALFGNLINKHVLKIRPKTGQANVRIGATCCAYSADGKCMVGGASDGTIHIWFTHSHYNRADIIIDCPSFTRSNVALMSVKESPSHPGYLASRYENGIIKLWKYSSKGKKEINELATFQEAKNVYEMSNIEFSPDGTILCCGTSLDSNDSNSSQKGMLYFYDILPFLGSNPPSSSISPPFMGIALPTGCSAICVKWSPKTNQIFCSTSNGKTRVFFDPRLSTKGAIITAGKAPKREKDPSDYALGEGAVFAPEALPMYKQEDPKKKKIKNADLRRDPIRSKIPERPAQKNAENTSFFFTKYIMEGRKNDLSHREDPREALLKMNEIASKDPIFFGAAYSQTQPKVLLHDESFEAEQERSKKRLRTGEE